MYGFQYYTPTRVVFERGAESRTAELIRAFGGSKVLIHYGGGSVVRSGLLNLLAVGGGGAMGSARLLREEDMLAIFRASR